MGFNFGSVHLAMVAPLAGRIPRSTHRELTTHTRVGAFVFEPQPRARTRASSIFYPPPDQQTAHLGSLSRRRPQALPHRHYVLRPRPSLPRHPPLLFRTRCAASTSAFSHSAEHVAFSRAYECTDLQRVCAGATRLPGRDSLMTGFESCS